MKKLKKLHILLCLFFLVFNNAILTSTKTEDFCLNNSKEQVAHSVITDLKELFKKNDSFFSDLQGKRIALLGITCGDCSIDAHCLFTIRLIEQLSKEGAIISAHLPKSNTIVSEVGQPEEIEINYVKNLFPDVLYHTCPYEAAKNSDAIIVVSAVESFKNLDFKYIASTVKNKIIIDTKNILDPVILKEAGFIIISK